MIAVDELPSLALFARVVHHRSFSAAAAEAGLAKSVVSRRVARLEKALGVRLLRRSTRTLSVTDEGLRVYEHAAALVAAATAATQSIGQSTKRVQGVLRVNAPVTFAQMHLADAVAAFLAAYPEVELHLSTDNRTVDVVEDGFDVVVRIGQLRDSDLYARKLASDRLVVCGSPEYLARAGEPTSPDELLQHNCLHYDVVARTAEWRFRGPRGAVVVPVRGNFVTTDGTVLCRAARAGLGLAVAPSFMIAHDLAGGRLRTVLDDWPASPVGIHALVAHRTGLPPRVRAFIDFLARRFAQGIPKAVFKSSKVPVRP
ncbi:LysR family transcriptional regulator [Pendulispora rubella]|uniref:LysR family transcriptional regulator n=1 Tax=Pendulispora rubella TaxID=2741070 RepID=A0ABZ2L1F4_9BACT